MDLNHEYDWRFSSPDAQLAVHMQNNLVGNNQKIFDATLSLERSEISSLNLARTLAEFPFMTGKVIVGIYYQALKMWLSHFPFYNYPKHVQHKSTKMEAPDSAKSR
jgi:hypothetical protein